VTLSLIILFNDYLVWLTGLGNHQPSPFLKPKSIIMGTDKVTPYQCIHGNLPHIQNPIKELHRKTSQVSFWSLGCQRLFIGKLDLAPRVMQKLVFGQSIRNWVSLLLSSDSSIVLIYGMLGPPMHTWGLREKYPLHRILCVCDHGDFSYSTRSVTLRISLYAYDAGLFANPTRYMLIENFHIFLEFRDARVLHTNL
jgi:hypothetical protein